MAPAPEALDMRSGARFILPWFLLAATCLWSARGIAEDSGGTRPRPRPAKLITLDLKEADIHNVLRFLAMEGRINIVVSEDVSGSLTLHLERVSWEQALRLILKVKGLGMERFDDAILVSPLGTLKQRLQEELELQDP